MASSLHFSADHLMKIYKEERGITIMEFARRKRVEVAKILLESSDLSVLEIAQILAFKSVSHFIRTFKACAGTTPYRYKITYEGRGYLQVDPALTARNRKGGR